MHRESSTDTRRHPQSTYVHSFAHQQPGVMRHTHNTTYSTLCLSLGQVFVSALLSALSLLLSKQASMFLSCGIFFFWLWEYSRLIEYSSASLSSRCSSSVDAQTDPTKGEKHLRTQNSSQKKIVVFFLLKPRNHLGNITKPKRFSKHTRARSTCFPS